MNILKRSTDWLLVFAAFLPSAAPLTAAEPLRPVLVDLVPRSLGDAPDPAFQTLLDADGLLDLRVEGRVLAEDRPPGRGSGAQLRRLAGLGPATQVPRAWVLLGPEGQVAGSGPALPGPEEITAALTAAGVRNPVVELTAFLGDHPGHDEARRDLLLALRPRLQGRLGALPPTPGHDLEPEQDARV